jgi:thiol-disulfide isomerase/thioredoxin
MDSGYLYEPPIIRENESMEKVMTADTIDAYLTQYKSD